MQEYEEEQATQPATQQLPAHHGVAPSDAQDYRGIICFLHPCSAAAIVIVQRAQLLNPALTFRLPKPEVGTKPAKNNQNPRSDNDSTQPADDWATEPTAVDLALRRTPGPKHSDSGFVFGRNVNKCDVVLAEPPSEIAKRISNQHFRIYVNVRGALMLEDMSTNGTWVDDKKLGKDSELGRKRVLSPGSIIIVSAGNPEDFIRFIVRIPRPSGNGLRSMGAAYSPSIGVTDSGYLVPKTPPQAAGPGAVVRSPHRNPAAIQRIPLRYREAHDPPTNKPIQPGIMDRHNMITPSIGIPYAVEQDYSIGDQIGKGAFATVSKAYERRSGDVVAIKIIAKRNFATQVGTENTGVKKEVHILQQLNHPNIVRYIGCSEDQTHIYLIMEHIEYGDLNLYLNEHGKMSESLTKLVTCQMLHGIEYIHRRGISHRDLKPDNILIAQQEPNMIVKISDFGLAKVVRDEGTFLKTFCGTMLYLAPEVFPGYAAAVFNDTPHDGPIKRKRLPDDEAGRAEPTGRKGKAKRRPYNQAVDMWSLGCVVYALLCGKPPFEGKNQDEMCKLVTQGIFDTARIYAHVGRGNHDCIDFLRKLLQVRPELRMMEAEALNHRWLLSESSIEESVSSSAMGESLEMELENAVLDARVEFQSDRMELESRVRVGPIDPRAQLGHHLGRDAEDEDDEDEDEDLSEDEGQPTPRPFKAQVKELELSANMSMMKVANNSPRSAERDNSSSSDEMYQSLANSGREFAKGSPGLSVIEREKTRKLELSLRGSSGVFPEAGWSLMEQMDRGQDKRNGGSETNDQYSQFASSEALGEIGVVIHDMGEEAGEEDGRPGLRRLGSLNGAESKLDKLNIVTATPSPYGTPPPQDKPKPNLQTPSFSFADERVGANFSPESLKNPSPQDPPVTPAQQRTPTRERDNVKNIPSTPQLVPDSQLPDTQPINSQATPAAADNFRVPPIPWGKLHTLPGSLPHDTITLADQAVTIGRSTGSTVIETDARISKHHLALQIHHIDKARQTAVGSNQLFKPDGDMVVTFQVMGRCGVWLEDKRYMPGEVAMVCDGDEILLFKDNSSKQFLGFRAELVIGQVKKEDRLKFSGIKWNTGTSQVQNPQSAANSVQDMAATKSVGLPPTFKVM